MWVRNTLARFLAFKQQKHTPSSGEETFHGHVIQSFACEGKSTTTLHHRDIVAMVIIVSSDVMTGVAATDDYCFLSFGVLHGLGELR